MRRTCDFGLMRLHVALRQGGGALGTAVGGAAVVDELTLAASPTSSDFARPEDCCAREHLRAARLERQSGNGVAAPKSAAGHGPAAFHRHAAETPFPAPSSSSRTQQSSGLYSVI